MKVGKNELFFPHPIDRMMKVQLHDPSMEQINELGYERARVIIASRHSIDS